MPNTSTVKRARKDLREGKSPSTAAGEFVHDEIEHVRQGKHGARSPQQAIAIGLNEARRAGVPVKPPKKGRAKASTRKSAARAYRKGQEHPQTKPKHGKASKARTSALKREPRTTASHRALSSHARSAAGSRKRSHKASS
ncbi:MAG: DUF6496 domain-containing protein [Terriglobales bacterium]